MNLVVRPSAKRSVRSQYVKVNLCEGMHGEVGQAESGLPICTKRAIHNHASQRCNTRKAASGKISIALDNTPAERPGYGDLGDERLYNACSHGIRAASFRSGAVLCRVVYDGIRC